MNSNESHFVDPVPKDDSWVVMDFVQQAGDSRNRYAEEKHRMISKAKWPSSQYLLSEKDAAEIWQSLASSPPATWTSGKRIHIIPCIYLF